MSDTDPENPHWVWDEVPHYRLNDRIIHDYLSEHWEGYNFFIELRGEKFRFWVPRKLKKVGIYPWENGPVFNVPKVPKVPKAERDGLLAKRIPKKKGK